MHRQMRYSLRGLVGRFPSVQYRVERVRCTLESRARDVTRVAVRVLHRRMEGWWSCTQGRRF